MPREDLTERIRLIESRKRGIVGKVLNVIYRKFYSLLKDSLKEVLSTIGRRIAEVDGDIDDFDYFDFENRFRGSAKDVKDTHKQYLKYLKGKKNVLDLGCGRGEFLELLGEAGIEARGVDIYEPFVKHCKSRNLDVVLEDAISYLEKLPDSSLDGITSFQVIEHVSNNYFVKLCNLCSQKLKKEGILIFETPNPSSLNIFATCFYWDPTHKRPLSLPFVRYVLEKADFRVVKVEYANSPDRGLTLQALPGSSKKESVYNENIKKLNERLFGPQDYAIIAGK